MVAAPGSVPPGGPPGRLSAPSTSPAEGSPYRSGSSDHRPDTVGGPVRVGMAPRRVPRPYRLDPAYPPANPPPPREAGLWVKTPGSDPPAREPPSPDPTRPSR